MTMSRKAPFEKVYETIGIARFLLWTEHISRIHASLISRTHLVTVLNSSTVK